MAKFSTRRLTRSVVKLVGRSFPDVAQELQEWLEWLAQQAIAGLPAGFNVLVPSSIKAGVVGSAGSQTDGWMSASAQIPIQTGAPTHPTDTVASEGSGAALMRADATIQQGIVTTKGDLLGFAAVPARIPVGIDGLVLLSDSTSILGVSWGQAVPGTGVQTPSNFIFPPSPSSSSASLDPSLIWFTQPDPLIWYAQASLAIGQSQAGQ